MKIKIISFILIFFLIAPPIFAANMQKTADIYFKVVETLDLSLNQQRKLVSIKFSEGRKLGPLMQEIKALEDRLENEKLSGREKQELQFELDNKKALASAKKRQYIARYRAVLSEEQNHKLDELIFDVANGYLKL